MPRSTPLVVFGLAVEVRKIESSTSGFDAASRLYHPKLPESQWKPQYGEMRISGFRDLLAYTACKLVIVGDLESRYLLSSPRISRAKATMEILLRDYWSAEPEQVSAITFDATKSSYMREIREFAKASDIPLSRCAILTDYFDLVRYLWDGDLAAFPTEAVSLALCQDGSPERAYLREMLMETFEDTDEGKRAVREISAVANRIREEWTFLL